MLTLGRNFLICMYVWVYVQEADCRQSLGYEMLVKKHP